VYYKENLTGAEKEDSKMDSFQMSCLRFGICLHSSKIFCYCDNKYILL